MNTKRAQLVIEVQAGIIPGEPMPEHTRQWGLGSEEVRDPDTYSAAVGAAMHYALALQQPQMVNWVRFEWIWL